LNSKLGSANCLKPGASTPRRCAPVRRGSPAARHPRPHLPTHLSDRGASTALPCRRTRALRAADRRSVRGAGRTSAGQGAVVLQHHRRHHAVIPEPPRYKRPSFSLPTAPLRRLPTAHRASATAARAPPPPAVPFTTCAPSTPPRTRGTSQGRLLSTSCEHLAGARTAAATAAGLRRIPTSACSPSQLRPPSGPR
jgi:hypothetical protein